MTTTSTTTTADTLAAARAERLAAESAYRITSAARDAAWQRFFSNTPGNHDAAYGPARDADDAARERLAAAHTAERTAVSAHWGAVLAQRVFQAPADHVGMVDDLAAALSPIISHFSVFESDKRQAIEDARAAGINNGESYGRFSWHRGMFGPQIVSTDGNDNPLSSTAADLLSVLAESLGRFSLSLERGSDGNPVIVSR